MKTCRKVVIVWLWVLSLAAPCTGLCQDFSVTERRGGENTELIKYANAGWQLMVNGKPYFVKGVEYGPVKVGQRLNESNLWMNYDFNKNGINDTAYESWVDKNSNNKKDRGEETVGDFLLMKEMGVNTIRIYHHTNLKKEILRNLYEKFGIRVVMGNFLGAYCWGSKASWEDGTDYTNSLHRQNMLDDLRSMVIEHKDESYVLMWMLGNENDAVGSYENSTFNNTNARKYPEEFAKFINEAAKLIKSIDPTRPVGVCNAFYIMLPYYKKYSPDIDFLGFNSYSGAFGFGSLFRTPKFYGLDLPILITEYGGDSYNQTKNMEDEAFQARYHEGAWRDMVRNSAAFGGPSIGGFAYNWLDAWWFCGKLDEHDTSKGAWPAATNDGLMNDEWLGICSQGNGRHSPFMRRLKKVYYFYKTEWNKTNI